MKKFLTALGTAALIAGQSAAVSAAPASVDRSGAAVGQSEGLGLGAGEDILLIVLVLSGVIGTAIAMQDGDDDRFDPEPFPASP